jgi:ubiquinone/menaquinone biosynthesis C-methylase UbiE
MEQGEIRRQWEGAAPGWAKWEDTIAQWVAPATDAMFEMAGIAPGARVLDLASGAGSQTLHAARRVGGAGHVVASDISETMLHHVRENARAAGLENVSTLAGAAEDLELEAKSFDAVTCRLGLMLFAEPAKALAAANNALRPGGKLAVVVVTTPAANPFLAEPMQILLQRAGKAPPSPGRPGLFALGAPGVLERLLKESGFDSVAQRTVAPLLRMPSAEDAIAMMQDAFGAYRAVVSDCSEAVRKAAWTEVAETLKRFETSAGFEGPTELLVVAGVKPGSRNGG